LFSPKLDPNAPCLGWHATTTAPYEYIDYAEVDLRSVVLGSSLINKLGLKPGI
jgi:hypothetical protein